MTSEDTETEKKDSHVKTEVEIVVMLAEAKERLGLPDKGRDKEGSSARVFKRSTVMPTPWYFKKYCIYKKKIYIYIVFIYLFERESVYAVGLGT